ncbi:hypothetical protein H257_04897 [Aphanomyces astaci]|uniref:Chromo domain-containing protein n=1 Tax=Aphanomyces astaci TaxID=112090 RepID=W4GS77_APHAT|nr:hypothetical protein H257_04897 [Aphanomyces astaci]ETV82186.1 hypothetical protein H257_04897 [Aphanomyces astaci]|eukprot:XP_009827855.1 hypothetical protein H257_04897 [Aphanomyces astaci]
MMTTQAASTLKFALKSIDVLNKLPTRTQIKTRRAWIGRKKSGGWEISNLADLITWGQAHLCATKETFFDREETFVYEEFIELDNAYRHKLIALDIIEGTFTSDSVESTYAGLVVTSRQNMWNIAWARDRQGDSLAIATDGTYKLHFDIVPGGWTLIDLGAVYTRYTNGSFRHRFLPWTYGTYLYERNAKRYFKLFDVTATKFEEFFDTNLVPATAWIDHTPYIYAALVRKWPNVHVVSCYVHMKRNVHKHKKLLRESNNYSRVKADIERMWLARSHHQFHVIAAICLSEWMVDLSEIEMSTWFRDVYLSPPWDQWFSTASYCPGVMPHQQHIESHHKSIKIVCAHELRATTSVVLEHTLPRVLVSDGLEINTSPALWDESVLSICAQFGLKLSPKKCHFFLREAEWCDKVISADGITHSPSRIQGLVHLSPPTTAADLQQFVCATNWMRASIPGYNQLVDPLRHLLDVATKAAGSCKKTALVRSSDYLKCFNDVKHALAHVVPLSHPREDMTVCVFTDASDLFWGAVATQVPPADLDLPLEDQRHQRLAFINGSFFGASARWPIVEKEAYAMVESCRRLDYLVVRPGGFRLFTDHRNLVYIFNPSGSNTNMTKYQADKLQRWSLAMSTFPYTIECDSGDANVWGDLLCRWGSAPADQPVVNVRKLIHVVSPLQQVDFEWPTAATIRGIQRSTMEGGGTLPNGMDWDDDSHFYVDPDGRIWIPDGAVDLQKRICVMAHQGASGHRRIAATTKSVYDKFMWKTLSTDVEAFVRACLHCLCIDGEMIPRPLGSALHVEKPNELIHFDWLSMPMAKSGQKQVLVVKDDMSGFIAFGDGGFHVERLDEARCVDGQHQVLVKWLGLDDEESSWEPAANLLDDIPVVFRKWAAANKEDPAVTALIKTRLSVGGEVFCSVQSNWVAR